MVTTREYNITQSMTNQSTPDPASADWRGMTPCDRGLSTPTIDDVFDLLSDWRRRTVCRYFVTTGSSAADVEPLAAAVARRTADSALDPAETNEEAIRAALVEEHLPRLDAAGVVDFDPRSDSVRYWGHPTVEKWAEHADAVSNR